MDIVYGCHRPHRTNYSVNDYGTLYITNKLYLYYYNYRDNTNYSVLHVTSLISYIISFNPSRVNCL